MTRLFSGLLLTSLLSLFLLGYLIDQLIDSEPAEYSASTIAAHLLDYMVNQSQTLQEDQLFSHYQQQAAALKLSLQLEPYQALALPTELAQQLTVQGGLALASAEQDYLLRQLPAHPQWILKLALPPEQQQHPLSLWLTLAFYSGLAMLLLLWLWPLMKRLNLLTKLAERFGKGELHIRQPYSRFSYIPRLERSFNRMAEQISQLLNENRLLAKSLSHDLRTPIACLRFGLEAAQEATTPEKTQQLLQRMEQDIDRMEAMVNSFLEFASLSRKAHNLTFSRHTMQHWLKDYCQHIEPLMLQHQLQLSLAMTDTLLYSKINALWLERALNNLISNACRFARSQVQISLSGAQSLLQISLSDDGPGIAATETTNVLLPFVKLDNPAQDGQHHFGLGLAICAEIMKWHKGKIHIDQDPVLAGARFTLSLTPCP